MFSPYSNTITVQTSCFNSYYQALLDKLTADGIPLPDASQKTKDNTFIDTLDVANVLQKHTGLYILGWHQYEAALYNWIAPNTYKCSFVGAMTSGEFTAFGGYKSKAASALNTGINPNTAGLPIDADNTTLWMWVDNISAKDIYMGVNSGANFCYNGVEGGTRYGRIHTSGAENLGSIGTGKNFIALKRINSTDVELWENGVLMTTINRTFTALANDVIYLCALKFGASPYVPQVGVEVFAAGIGGDIDIATLYNALVTYK